MAYAAMAEVYDELMGDMPYPEWIRFTTESWQRLGQPKTVVDLGCGTGSIAVPIARMGIDVIGIDLSADMLALAERKKAAAAQKDGSRTGSMLFLQQDMREWELAEPVECVISYCDSLNYLLEEADILAAFERTYEGLQPGGLFLFDMLTPYQLQRYAEEQPFVLDDERISYIWFSEFDQERCEIEHQLTIFMQEATSLLYRRIEEAHVQRAYDQEWIRDALQSCGFSNVYSMAEFAWDKQPGPQTERIFFAAQK